MGGQGQRRLRVGRWSGSNLVYHVSFVTANRLPMFTDLRLGRAVIDSLRWEHEAHNVDSMCFCLMPDHCHWLFALTGGRSLSVVINTVKSLSARRVNRALNRSGSVWQRSFYDRAIRREEDLEAVARYIVANPVRAGLVRSVRDYPHWDAVWI